MKIIKILKVDKNNDCIASATQLDDKYSDYVYYTTANAATANAV